MNQSGSEKQSWRYVVSKNVFLTLGKVGCLTFVIAAGSAFLGWWMDRMFGTQPWLMLIFFIVSVPVSMVAIYLVAIKTLPLILKEGEHSIESKEDLHRGENS